MRESGIVRRELSETSKSSRVASSPSSLGKDERLFELILKVLSRLSLLIATGMSYILLLLKFKETRAGNERQICSERMVMKLFARVRLVICLNCAAISCFGISSRF